MKKLLAMISVLLMACIIFAPMTAFAYLEDYTEYDHLAGIPDTGIMDFSWMNEMPAGQRGFVQVKEDGNFYFEDGTPVKFWGSVCGFDGAWMSKEDAEKTAADLASMGVNFIRLHAFDCIWGGNSSGIIDFSTYKNGMGTGPKGFNEINLDRMDYLIYCLKEKGIYIHLDTSAGRRITTGEGFDNDEAVISRDSILRGAHYFDDRVSKIEYDYVEDFITHVNPYTGKTYAEETAIAVIQRANESSSLWVDWANNGGNSDNGFTLKLKAEFNEWLLEKYGSREALAQAWTNDRGQCGLGADEDPTQGTVKRGKLGNWSEPNYLSNMTSATDQNHCRHVDWIDFLCQEQREDFTNFSNLLREKGYGGSINCSNLMVGIADVSNNFLGDVMEMNWYFNCGNTSTEYSLVESCMDGVGSMQAHLIPYIAHASAAGKALVVTECEVGHLSDFRSDALITIASYAALQDWDGFCMWIYAADGPVWNPDKGMSLAKYDPAYFGQMGLAAMIFRNGLVSPAENSVEYVFTADDVLANNGSPMGITTPLSFVSKIGYNFIDEVYEGNADLVFASGNTASGDYSKANKLVISNTLPYSDGFQKVKNGEEWLNSYIEDGAVDKTFGSRTFKVGTKTAVFNGDNSYANTYSVDTEFINDLMREFGLWDDTVGFIDGKVVSDTNELTYDYKNGNLTCATEQVCYITGRLPGTAEIGSVKYTSTNDKATIALLSTDGKSISDSEALYLYACGRSRNKVFVDGEFGPTYLGSGPVFFQDVRGTLFFESDNENCYVWGLDAYGNKVAQIETTKKDGGYEFEIGGYLNYEIRTNYTLTGDELPESSAPQESSSQSSSSQSSQTSQTSQNSQGGSNDEKSSPVIWIVIAAVVVVAVIVVIIISSKKKK